MFTSFSDLKIIIFLSRFHGFDDALLHQKNESHSHSFRLPVR